MKRAVLLLTIVFFGISSLLADGYKIGDKAKSFKLKNVDGKFLSLDDFEDAKGFVVIFTCNNCPYAIAYEDRIIDLHNKYSKKGFPVIAVNPNDPGVSPGDSFEAMKVKAEEKSFPFPYLFDEGREVSEFFGATRTPHVFVLKKNDQDLIVSYIGTIDDNYKDASKAEKHYLSDALDALLEGQKPNPDITKAIGCSVKKKKV